MATKASVLKILLMKRQCTMLLARADGETNVTPHCCSAVFYVWYSLSLSESFGSWMSRETRVLTCRELTKRDLSCQIIWVTFWNRVKFTLQVHAPSRRHASRLSKHKTIRIPQQQLNAAQQASCRHRCGGCWWWCC